MTFTQHVTFTVTTEGLIERGTGGPRDPQLCPFADRRGSYARNTAKFEVTYHER